MYDGTEKATELFDLAEKKLQEELAMAEKVEGKKNTEETAKPVEANSEGIEENKASDGGTDSFDWVDDFEFPEEADMWESSDDMEAEPLTEDFKFNEDWDNWNLSDEKPTDESTSEFSFEDIAEDELENISEMIEGTKAYYSSELRHSLYTMRKELQSIGLIVRLIRIDDMDCYDRLSRFVELLSKETSKTLQDVKSWLNYSAETNSALNDL